MALLDRPTDRSSSAQPEELRLTLGEHLEELRTRLFRIILLIGVGMVAGWFFVDEVYTILIAQVQAGMPKNIEYEVVWKSLTTPFMFQLKMAFILGLIFTLPLTVIQLWAFIAPGLREQERRPIRIVVPISSLLFFLGAYLGYVILPPTMGWFAGMASVFPTQKILQDPAEIITFCAKMILSFGVGFQLPILVFFLTKIGLISSTMISRYWRQALVGIFTFTAVVTPSGDPLSMMVMALPLTILFFASVYAAQWTNRGKRDDSLDVLNNLD